MYQRIYSTHYQYAVTRKSGTLGQGHKEPVRQAVRFGNFDSRDDRVLASVYYLLLPTSTSTVTYLFTARTRNTLRYILLELRKISKVMHELLLSSTHQVKGRTHMLELFNKDE